MSSIKRIARTGVAISAALALSACMPPYFV